MATTSTTTNTLGVGLDYYDEIADRNKTTYLKIPDPRTNLTESEIKAAVMNLISGDEPIFKAIDGDKFNTETAISTAYTEAQEVIEVDTGYVD